VQPKWDLLSVIRGIFIYVTSNKFLLGILQGQFCINFRLTHRAPCFDTSEIHSSCWICWV